MLTDEQRILIQTVLMVGRELERALVVLEDDDKDGFGVGKLR